MKRKTSKEKKSTFQGWKQHFRTSFASAFDSMSSTQRIASRLICSCHRHLNANKRRKNFFFFAISSFRQPVVATALPTRRAETTDSSNFEPPPFISVNTIISFFFFLYQKSFQKFGSKLSDRIFQRNRRSFQRHHQQRRNLTKTKRKITKSSTSKH